MTPWKRAVLLAAIALLAGAAGTWLWFELFELRPVARTHVSDAARKNPMLAATRLLQSRSHPVTVHPTLSEALRAPLPAGTLLLTDGAGIMTPAQADALLAWVRQGNTVVFRPPLPELHVSRHCGHDADFAAPRGERSGKPHPLAAAMGVELVRVTRYKESRKPADDEADGDGAADGDGPREAPARPLRCLAEVPAPGGTHALRVGVNYVLLSSAPWRGADSARPVPVLQDRRGEAVRVFAVGQGHVVALAANYFDNHNLLYDDDGELLLALAGLNPRARQVLLVQRLELPPWYASLWWAFPLGIAGAGCTLLLLAWRAAVRFGPPLPSPDGERRALIEHVDATGRWLWKVPGGRDLLLAASRSATEALLRRRAPALAALAPDERARHLAEACGLAARDVRQALDGPAAQAPQEFTRQIRTLQRLRMHHER